MEFIASEGEDRSLVELRRKVRSSELLSAAMEKLLSAIRFTGRVSIVVQNGRVLKSGCEEGCDIAAALLAELGISAKPEEEPAADGEVAATVESNWVE